MTLTTAQIARIKAAMAEAALRVQEVVREVMVEAAATTFAEVVAKRIGPEEHARRLCAIQSDVAELLRRRVEATVAEARFN